MNKQATSRGTRVLAVIIFLSLICVITLLISLNTGTIRLSPLTVFQTLFGYGNYDDTMVLFDYRLPRILVTMLAGMGLGVSGAILQGVTRNSLADPGILGLHAGASFGLIVFVSFFHTLEGMSSILIPLFTFAGGVAAALLIVLLAYDRHKGVLPIRLLLVGIAVAAGFSAITLFLSLRLDEDTYTFAARWLVGNVWGRDWVNVYALLPWIVIFVPYAYFQSKTLDSFSLGDEVATSLGTPVRRQRYLLLACAVALSSASVSMAGGIGFIGLAAPHLARRLVGPIHQHFLPVAGLIGLVILVVADTIGRSIFQPNSIPAGVVVAAVGAPYFLYLLVRTK
ncbi:iron ABC transporter permease [Paenibacillus baekrokdamisoli]|uniref:Iron ABC transporter permease n=1 Tax=Paenibacillus baekrokdamisoli TaxID=1712516 RepID=A0A3G9JI89_9BACL|nr:iron ABC transporter permease [Paenibacillus baekrokdamisoli]MBB3068967.1 iron complex transport system permease protein [Paenibacillus baekrokdamisoli]BBH23788.1 iron ABC transporter permease [Paenibacillus baekrokdamisoli]